MSIEPNKSGDWRLLLANKVVFLTGGAGWLARYIAKTCYDHGARVVLADLDTNVIKQVKNEVFGSEDTDDKILIVQLDVQKEETIKKAVELTLNKWNTINILINTFDKKEFYISCYSILSFFIYS